MNELEELMRTIKELVNLDADDEVMQLAMNQVQQQFSPEIINQSVNQIIHNLENQGATKEEAKRSIDALVEVLDNMVYGDNQFTGSKKDYIDFVMNKMKDIFNTALEKYHSYSIVLPMTVNTLAGANVPTYAHDTDAAADLYAQYDQNIPAHTYGNMVKTGVKIQLPEGWLAMILPRSSIGLKTPLRLSNSVGLIDSGYRGELGVIYDNTSDNDYEIKAGDRVAQLLVMPSYRFQAKVVNSLEDSDRGETGFGDSGK